ncbi:LysR family transcriptional regulator ArgP [Spongorhabdus nitratireducens]
MRLDYKLLQALDAVVNRRSFEGAADLLCITQSAVSQRIRQLEKQMGQPLVVRSQPPTPTPTGQKLLGLYRRVQLLEQEVLPELQPDINSGFLHIPIAVNADSIGSWLIPGLAPLLKRSRITLDMQVMDESMTLKQLQSGEAVGAISLEQTPLPGCKADYLGKMDYVCVATPDFMQRYFPDGVTAEAMVQAPFMSFDTYDDLHQRFLEQHFSLPPGATPGHRVRSTEAFTIMAKEGIACGVIPKMMIEKELENSELVELIPGLIHSRSLYWHRWSLESGLLQELSEQIIKAAHQSMQ